MRYRVLVLGASYGSLLGTKCLAAGHDVTLVCREATAKLIRSEGTEVRIRLKGEDTHRSFFSRDLPGTLDACAPEAVDVSRYDIVVLAMQEPQCVAHSIRSLLIAVAEAGLPCLSLMNMPPLAFLKRIPGTEPEALEAAYTDARVWQRFVPGAVSLCSPDPQAFRPPEERPNVLHVGLATNFKAAPFADDAHTAILKRIEADIDAVQFEGLEVPVKLRVHDSLYVPLAKWSMLLTGNYRCVLPGSIQSIRDAVHGDREMAREIYDHVAAIVVRLGADPADLVPFEKYAQAAQSLLKPSSVARAIVAGAPCVERVDKLVQSIGRGFGMGHSGIDRTVAIIDKALRANRTQAA